MFEEMLFTEEQKESLFYCGLATEILGEIIPKELIEKAATKAKKIQNTLSHKQQRVILAKVVSYRMDYNKRNKAIRIQDVIDEVKKTCLKCGYPKHMCMCIRKREEK